MIVPVILSGGSGTRLWPLSTAVRPKQFLPLIGEESLFRQTLARVADRQSYHPPVVVANLAHMDLCLDELADRDCAQLILEPCARNTAAAIVMAAETVKETFGPDHLVLVMPSDHLIGDPAGFQAAVRIGKGAAEAGRIVTFGITPTSPETGYGYLEAGPELEEARGSFEVARFTEKPELPTAQAMITSGRHYWNGGIFLFRVKDFLREAAVHATEVHACSVRAISQAEQGKACILPSRFELEACPNLSVDYAIMERSDRIAMVPLTADWSDVGSWDAVANLSLEATDLNSVTAVQSENCFVRSDGAKVALLGVNDLVVVSAGDQILVMRRGKSQAIRQLVHRVSEEA